MRRRRGLKTIQIREPAKRAADRPIRALGRTFSGEPMLVNDVVRPKGRATEGASDAAAGGAKAAGKHNKRKDDYE
jgi:hypothetical protein